MSTTRSETKLKWLGELGKEWGGGGMEHKPGSNSGYLLRVSVGGARIDGRTELLVATHQMETSLLKHKRSKTLATKD